MGRKSVKENKNIYQTIRENQDMSRQAASDAMEIVSTDRIEAIESEKSLAHPDEILAMAQAYGAPELCNYYCSHECPIGIEYTPSVEIKEFSQTILATLTSVNNIMKERDTLMSIGSDGKLDDFELEDFIRIQNELEKLSITIESLQLWFEKHTLEKGYTKEFIQELKNKVSN